MVGGWNSGGFKFNGFQLRLGRGAKMLMTKGIY